VQTGIGSVYMYLTVNLEWTVNAEKNSALDGVDGVRESSGL